MNQNINLIHLVTIFALSAISGWCYRRGGSDKTWHGKERDWGVSFITLQALAVLLKPEVNLKSLVIFAAVFLTSWISLSSYWRWINPKADGVKAINWALHGFGVGLACLPLYAIGVPLWAILMRAVVLAGIMTVISEASDNVVVEEWGRGASIIFTLPLLVAG